MLRTFSDNPTCRHIIFGGCHDAGYLLNLDQYKHNALKAAHITLLESTPAWRGFSELPNFRRARFDNVFRNTELPESVYRPQTHPPVQYPMQTPVQSPVSLPVKRAVKNPSPPPGFGTPLSGSQSLPLGFNNSPRETPTMPSPATTTSSLATGNPTPEQSDSSWATVGKNGVPPNETIVIASKSKTDNKKWAYYNAKEERLDEPLPPKDKAALEAIDHRMKKVGRNLCNNWHLTKGKCINGTKCHFQHEPKLSSAELNALRYKTRSLACKDRYCQNVDCCEYNLRHTPSQYKAPYLISCLSAVIRLSFYLLTSAAVIGHQCAFERDQGYCPFPDSCNFRHTHGMDRVKASRWNENGDMELL